MPQMVLENLMGQLELAKENYVKEHRGSSFLSSGVESYLQWKVMDQLELMSRQYTNGEIEKELIADYVIEYFVALLDEGRFDV